MVRLLLLLGVGVVLAGCAPTADTPMTARGNFSSYRDLLADQSLQIIDRKVDPRLVPRPVMLAYVGCAADYAMSSLSAEDKARLDAYARHEVKMSNNEAKAIERQMRERIGGDLTLDTLDRLNGTCPADVPSFKEYLGPVFQRT